MDVVMSPGPQRIVASIQRMVLRAVPHVVDKTRNPVQEFVGRSKFLWPLGDGQCTSALPAKTSLESEEYLAGRTGLKRLSAIAAVNGVGREFELAIRTLHLRHRDLATLPKLHRRTANFPVQDPMKPR